MEYLSLFLAIALLGVFFYVCTAGRVKTARKAGPLVLRVLRPVKFGWRLGAVGLGGLASVICGIDLILNLDEGAGPGMLTKSALWAVLAPLWTVKWLRELGCALEVRRLGIVPHAGLSKRFVRWDRMKYCEWMHPRGTLFVQCKYYRSMSYRIRPEQMDAVSKALCPYVEVRDDSGLPLVAGSEPLPRPGKVESVGEDDGRPESRPRRFQFGLSTLLLAVLVASAGFSWIGIRVRRTRAQKEVVATLQPFRPNVTFRGGKVVQLGFAPSGSRPSDADLALLKKLVWLERLDLSNTQITDAGLPHLEEMASLKWLDLSRTQITDAGLAHLKGMARLFLVDLTGTRVTDAGLQELQRALPDLSIRTSGGQPIGPGTASPAGRNADPSNRERPPSPPP